MWLDRVVKLLLPREEHFFDLLERGSGHAVECSVLLVECCAADSYVERQKLVDQMRDVEHAADHVIHETYDALNKTFVTPLDRSDIFALARELENITDAVCATALHIMVHAMEDVPEGSLTIARQIKEACAELDGAVKLLRKLRDFDGIRTRCKAVNKLEHDGDQVFRSCLSEMFKHEKDAIRLLKHKEFLEGLERTLDVCDDVANVLETVVIKNA